MPSTTEPSSQSQAEKDYRKAIAAVPDSEFAATYAPSGAQFDEVVVRWNPPEVRFDVSMQGRSYQVRVNQEQKTLTGCMQVFGTWVCEDDAQFDIGGMSLPQAAAALDPRELAKAAEALADTAGAKYSYRKIAGVKSACVQVGESKACLAPTGAPMLLSAVPGLELPGVPEDVEVEAVGYSKDSGI